MWNNKAYENIVFVGIGRIRDRAMLYEFQNPKLEQKEKAFISNVVENFLSEAVARYAAGSRQKRLLEYSGEIYFYVDKTLTCIYSAAVQGSKRYPERLAMELISEIVQLINRYETHVTLQTNPALALNKNTTVKRAIQDLIQKYDVPENFDQAFEIQRKVDNAKDTMNANIQKIVNSQFAVDDLTGKSDHLAYNSLQFTRSAHDYRKILWWENKKMNLLFIIVAAAIIIYIIIFNFVST